VKNPRLGLTHNQGGAPGAATVSVVIAGNELDWRQELILD
jgi:hypothetical protein